MEARWKYARLLARARNDGAAGPVIGLIVAAVLYLLLFSVLLGVTQSQTDTTRVDHRVLQDRAESTLSLLLGSSGEALLPVTPNAFLTLPAGGGAPTGWTLANGATSARETTNAVDYTKLARSSQGDLLTTARVPVTPDGKYQAVLHGYVAAASSPATLDVTWWKTEDANQALRTDVAVASLAETAPGVHVAASAKLTPPPEATRATLKVRGATAFVNYTALQAPDTRSWESNPDGLQRFGLLENNLDSFGYSAGRLPNILDYAKLSSLRRGYMASGANGAPDYPDVRRAMGMGDEYQFHIRTYPVFPELDGTHVRDEAIELAYLGHFLTNPAPAILGTVTVTPGPGTPPAYIDFDIPVTNDGSSPMAYRLTLSLHGQGGGTQDVHDNLDTPVVAPGGTVSVQHRLYGQGTAANWGLGDKIVLALHDALSNPLATAEVTFTKPADTGNDYNVKVEPASAYFLHDEPVQIFLDHFDAKGKRLNAAQSVDVVILNSAGGVVWQSAAVPLPKNSHTSITCGGCGSADVYVVVATAGARSWSEKFEVLNVPLFQTATETDASKVESGILADIVSGFTNTTLRAAGCDASLLAGDKYLDTRDGTIHLVDRLLNPDGSLCYHTLVVGSSVRHSAMTSAKVKYGISDWVMAGGTLIVLGSDAQNVEWLQPLAGQGLRGAGGGIAAPDATHPILNAPQQLAYKSYRDPGRAWSLRSGSEDMYTHVLVRDDQNGQSNDMLAISAPGAFGRGTVVLAAYQPWDLFATPGPDAREEGKRFLHNMVSQTYTMLYVDYGPSIPPGTPVSSAARLVLVPHPLVTGALVQVEVLLYVWRG